MGKHFLWDPVEDNTIEEFDDAGNTIADYTTEPRLYGDLISQHRDGKSSFYHYDGQGSTTSLTDSAAGATDTYAYSAFGELTVRTGSTVNPFQYVGRKQYYRDSETREYKARRRPMASSLGRWLSVDPLYAEDSELLRGSHYLELFAYCHNNPLVFSDASGLKPKACLVDYFNSSEDGAFLNLKEQKKDKNTEVTAKGSIRYYFHGLAIFNRNECCDCCAFRQCISGTVRQTHNGTDWKTTVTYGSNSKGGVCDSPYEEDINADGAKYGYDRVHKTNTYDWYQRCGYQWKDRPGHVGLINDVRAFDYFRIETNLQFMFKIIDTCNNGKVVASKEIKLSFWAEFKRDGEVWDYGPKPDPPFDPADTY